MLNSNKLPKPIKNKDWAWPCCSGQAHGVVHGIVVSRYVE